jgi:hypothetical protein
MAFRDRPRRGDQGVDIDVDLRRPTSVVTITARRAGYAPASLELEVPSSGEAHAVLQIRSRWGIDPYAAAAVDRDEVLPAWGLGRLTIGDDVDPYVHLALFQSFGQLLSRCHVAHLAAVLDVVSLRRVNWQLPGFFVPLPDTAAIALDGERGSMPVWCDVDAWSKRIVGTDLALLRWFFDGVPPTPLIEPPPWATLAPSLDRLAASAAD